MIGEAVDTAITLARALAAHDSVAVPAYLAMVVAVAALVCGHQGQPWPIRRRQTPHPPRPRVPSWAHAQPLDAGDGR